MRHLAYRRAYTGRGIRTIVGRNLGWLLIVLAATTAGHEVISIIDTSQYEGLVFGELWA